MSLYIQPALRRETPRATAFYRVSYASQESLFIPPLDTAGNSVSRRLWNRKRCLKSLSTRPSSIAARDSDHSDLNCASDNNTVDYVESTERARSSRRNVLIAPFFVIGASFLLSAATRAEEKAATLSAEVKTVIEMPVSKPAEQKEEEEVITSRTYDATVIGEPLAIGKDKRKVWDKLMSARIVYLGEAEQVPIRDDKELELEIVKNWHKRCMENDRKLSLALEAFHSVTRVNDILKQCKCTLS